jgi:photosystem II stability/assembly factor-like uncharacterized protein
MASAQSWETMNPMPTGNTINGISFINADTGFMACGDQNILRTMDGGIHWSTYNGGSGSYFVDVDFVSNTMGFVIGNDSRIGRTLDCGQTWDFITGPGESTYRKMNFSDEQHGWICGWYNTLLRTQNAGETWTLLSQNIWGNLHYSGMDFMNADTGYITGAVGWSSGQPRLFRTVNGGVTVESVPVPVGSEELSSIDVLNFNDIWICEGNQISGSTRAYHTTDAGLSWKTVIIGMFTHTGDNIQFLTPLKGRITGENMCFITDDGGLTWYNKMILPEVYPVSFSTSDWINDSTAFVAGSNGYMAKTQTTGNTWQSLSDGSRASFTDIAFGNTQTGCAVGSEAGNDFIYLTSDGGETWTSALNSTSYEGWILDIAYASEKEVWAAGSLNRVFHSTDGGSTWAMISPSENELDYFYSICPINGGRIYAGGKTLAYSDDNGLNWQNSGFVCPGYTIRKVLFTDPLNGYLALWETGTYTAFWGKLFRTSDGGITWDDLPYEQNGVSTKILAVDFLNKDTGLISIYGSGLARTTDGGNTWEWQGYHSNMEACYLKMFNDREAVAVTFSGNVFYSYNGGISWEQVELSDASQSKQPINDFIRTDIVRKPLVPENIDGLAGTFFSSMGSGWLCRDGGLIKKYTDLTVDMKEPIVKQLGGYKVYPDPVSTRLNITGDIIPEQVSIYNNQGKCMQQYKGAVKVIDVSRLPKGVYLIQITNERQQQALRFVKH